LKHKLQEKVKYRLYLTLLIIYKKNYSITLTLTIALAAIQNEYGR
jgi:hypothetical protein